MEESMRRFDCTTSSRAETIESPTVGIALIDSLSVWKLRTVATVADDGDHVGEPDLAQAPAQPHHIGAYLRIRKPGVLPGEHGQLPGGEMPARMPDEEVEKVGLAAGELQVPTSEHERMILAIDGHAGKRLMTIAPKSEALLDPAQVPLEVTRS